MRKIRAGMPSIPLSRRRMNGKAAGSSARSGVTAASTSRARAPTSVALAHSSVSEVQNTSRSGHSVCSHSSSQSSTAAALPVVVVIRKRSAARRAPTPSSNTMPSSRHIMP